MAATTLAKIRIDIPCPMPRWVMSSASHMTKAVPAVRHMTMKAASGKAELGDQVDVGAQQGGVVAVEGVDQARRLHQGQRHRQVPGGLGDLLLPHGALVAPLLQLGDDRRQQLNDDGAGDVGHDAQAEDGQAHQRPTAEEVEEAENARGRRRALERLQPAPVHPRYGDVGPDLVEGDDGQGEDDLVAKVGDPEDVGEPGEHGRASGSVAVRSAVTTGSSRRCPMPEDAHGRREGASARRYRPQW